MSVKRYLLDLPHRQYKGESAIRQLQAYVGDYFYAEDKKGLEGLKRPQWAAKVYEVLVNRGILSADTSGLLVISEPRKVAHRSKYVQLLKEFKLGHPIKKRKLPKYFSTKKPVIVGRERPRLIRFQQAPNYVIQAQREDQDGPA